MKAIKKSILALAFLGALIAWAEGMRSDPERISGYSISHYDLAVEIVPAKKFISAKAIMTVEGLTSEATTVRLFLHEEFTVRSVSLNGESLKFATPEGIQEKPMYSPSAKTIDIELPRAGNRTAAQKIEIVYSGPISKTINGVNLISEDLTEIAGYCAWFPLEKENGRFTYSLRMTLPAGCVSVTDGELVEESEAAGKITRLYRRETVGFDIPDIASGNLKVKGREAAGIKAYYYYRNMDDRLAEESLTGAIQSFGLMSRVIGAPAVQGKMYVVASPRAGWGYSRVPMIVGPEELISNRLASEKGKIEDFHGSAHEIGHFWWNIADSSTSNDWINEGLAEFFALCAVEQVYGRAEVSKILKSYAIQILGLTGAKPIVDTLRNERTSYTLYYMKGSYFWEMLRSIMGEEKLFSFLKNFYQGHRNRRDATTPELISSLVRAGGEEIRPFVNEFLTKNTFPDVKADWRYQNEKVAGKVIIENSAIAKFPLEIRFERTKEAKSESRTIPVSTGENPFNLAVSLEPDSATIDPNRRFLWADPELFYPGKINPLVHGPDMNFLPDIIPAQNIEKAGVLLAEWQTKVPNSSSQNYEWGWYYFLKEDYRKAIDYLEKVIPYISSLSFRMQGVHVYSALGRCYDLIGDRRKALTFYEEGERMADQEGAADYQKKGWFGNYRQRPYQRKTIHIASLLGDLERVKALFNQDPNLANARDDFYEMPPAFWAIQSKVRLDVLECLITHGADVNARNSRGEALLAVAKSKKDKALIELLISRGAKEEY